MESLQPPTLEQIFGSMRKAMGTIPWIPRPTHYMFFTGKGGVGKTSLACATAVALNTVRKMVTQRQRRFNTILTCAFAPGL